MRMWGVYVRKDREWWREAVVTCATTHRPLGRTRTEGGDGSRRVPLLCRQRRQRQVICGAIQPVLTVVERGAPIRIPAGVLYDVVLHGTSFRSLVTPHA